ncbi:hypothetical protein F5878DRAFT_675117, partial [Lentinula raphanica]
MDHTQRTLWAQTRAARCPRTPSPTRDEENPFVANAQALTAFNESISAVGNRRPRISAFGPAPVLLPTVTTENIRGVSESTEYVYQTAILPSGEHVRVLTPKAKRVIEGEPVPPLQPPPTPSRAAARPTQVPSLPGNLQGRHHSRDWEPRRDPPSDPPGFPRDEPDDEGPPDGPRRDPPEGPPDDGPPDDGPPEGPPGRPGNDRDPPDPPPNPPPSVQSRSSSSSRSSDNLALNALMSFNDTLADFTLALHLKESELDSGKTKVKDPEPFDGSNPRKLKSFLVSLSLVFIDRPNYFTDQRKINYTLSYLTGAAREWFEPDILDPNVEALPAWTTPYAALVQELQENFGLYDAQAHMPEPRTLSEYRREVLRLDNRYWRREEERKRESHRFLEPSDPKKGKKDGKKPVPFNSSQNSGANQSSLSSGLNFNNQKKFGNSNNKGNSGNKFLKKSITDNLGSDGKLTPAERERCKKFNLCLFCGQGGHVLKDCPRKKSKENAAKGRAGVLED